MFTGRTGARVWGTLAGSGTRGTGGGFDSRHDLYLERKEVRCMVTTLIVVIAWALITGALIEAGGGQ